MKKADANAGDKKNKNENSSTPSIQKFFKKAPKLRRVGKNGESKDIDDVDDTKAVYIEFLKKKLQEFEDGSEAAEREECQNEMEPVGASAVVMNEEIIAPVEAGSQCTGCKEWECKYKDLENDHIAHINGCKACSDWENKYKNLKKDYMKMGTNFAELRIAHDDLLKTKTYTHTDHSAINDVVSSSGGIFTSNEIAVLQNLPLDQKTDSTFILKCLKYAYKNDTSVLRYRTLKGTPESMVVSDDGDVAFMPGKDPLSPQKIESIRAIFVERINKCNLKPAAYDIRIKDPYMNKLVAASITNIGKKQNNLK